MHGADLARAVRVVRACADGGKAGVKPKTIADVRAGREPKSAPKDERAIYAFVQELYKTRRVSDRTYKRLHAIIGDEATVELVGILGYYALISMTLNVFRMMPPADAKLGFAEPIAAYLLHLHAAHRAAPPMPGLPPPCMAPRPSTVKSTSTLPAFSNSSVALK